MNAIESEFRELREFKKAVTDMAARIRKSHMQKEHYEGKTFYPTHPLVILAAFVEEIEALNNNQEK